MTQTQTSTEKNANSLSLFLFRAVKLKHKNLSTSLRTPQKNAGVFCNWNFFLSHDDSSTRPASVLARHSMGALLVDVFFGYFREFERGVKTVLLYSDREWTTMALKGPAQVAGYVWCVKVSHDCHLHCCKNSGNFGDAKLLRYSFLVYISCTVSSIRFQFFVTSRRLSKLDPMNAAQTRSIVFRPGKTRAINLLGRFRPPSIGKRASHSRCRNKFRRPLPRKDFTSAGSVFRPRQPLRPRRGWRTRRRTEHTHAQAHMNVYTCTCMVGVARVGRAGVATLARESMNQWRR